VSLLCQPALPPLLSSLAQVDGVIADVKRARQAMADQAG
jgi:hypothetical protein